MFNRKNRVTTSITALAGAFTLAFGLVGTAAAQPVGVDDADSQQPIAASEAGHEQRFDFDGHDASSNRGALIQDARFTGTSAAHASANSSTHDDRAGTSKQDHGNAIVNPNTQAPSTKLR